jgi:hypothetical protein
MLGINVLRIRSSRKGFLDGGQQELGSERFVEIRHASHLARFCFKSFIVNGSDEDDWQGEVEIAKPAPQLNS